MFVVLIREDYCVQQFTEADTNTFSLHVFVQSEFLLWSRIWKSPSWQPKILLLTQTSACDCAERTWHELKCYSNLCWLRVWLFRYFSWAVYVKTVESLTSISLLVSVWSQSLAPDCFFTSLSGHFSVFLIIRSSSDSLEPSAIDSSALLQSCCCRFFFFVLFFPGLGGIFENHLGVDFVSLN